MPRRRHLLLGSLYRIIQMPRHPAEDAVYVGRTRPEAAVSDNIQPSLGARHCDVNQIRLRTCKTRNHTRAGRIATEQENHMLCFLPLKGVDGSGHSLARVAITFIEALPDLDRDRPKWRDDIDLELPVLLEYAVRNPLDQLHCPLRLGFDPVAIRMLRWHLHPAAEPNTVWTGILTRTIDHLVVVRDAVGDAKHGIETAAVDEKGSTQPDPLIRVGIPEIHSEAVRPVRQRLRRGKRGRPLGFGRTAAEQRRHHLLRHADDRFQLQRIAHDDGAFAAPDRTGRLLRRGLPSLVNHQPRELLALYSAKEPRERGKGRGDDRHHQKERVPQGNRPLLDLGDIEVTLQQVNECAERAGNRLPGRHDEGLVKLHGCDKNIAPRLEQSRKIVGRRTVQCLAIQFRQIP